MTIIHNWQLFTNYVITIPVYFAHMPCKY